MILLPEEDIFGDNTHIHIEPFNHTVIKSPYAKKKPIIITTSKLMRVWKKNYNATIMNLITLDEPLHHVKRAVSALSCNTLAPTGLSKETPRSPFMAEHKPN